jgi:hypothetical protein
MSALPQAVSIVSPMPRPVLSSAMNDTPLTRVSLAFVAQRINLYLRFGHPVREPRLDRWRRSDLHTGGSVLPRAGSPTTTVRRAGSSWFCRRAPLDAAQRIAGIRPGARLLLCAEGELQVQSVLPQIDAIETLGIDPVAVSPAYWRTLGNRLSARLPLPIYTAERHAAYLAGEVLR